MKPRTLYDKPRETPLDPTASYYLSRVHVLKRTIEERDGEIATLREEVRRLKMEIAELRLRIQETAK